VRLQADAEPEAATGKRDAYAPYRVVLATGLADRPRDDNVLGAPASVRAATADADFAAPINLMDGSPQPGPSPCLGSQQLFLLGPPGADARNTIAPPPRGAVPAATPRLQTASLEYQRTFDPATPEEKSAGLTVLLRRLANRTFRSTPGRAWTDPNGDVQPNPWYNPYVTVDYLEGVPLNDAAAAARYASRGKRQPYAAHPDQQADQVSSQAGPRTQHTFGLPNNPTPTAGRCDWLVHLDRELISPPELLHVSACQPYQLTRRFIDGDGSTPQQKFQHLAPWFDQSRRLYRAFEFFTTHGRGAGAPNVPAGACSGRSTSTRCGTPRRSWRCATRRQPTGRTSLAPRSCRSTSSCWPCGRRGSPPAGGPARQTARSWDSPPAMRLPTGPDNPDPQHPGRGSGINDTLLRAAAADADGQPGGGAALARLFPGARRGPPVPAARAADQDLQQRDDTQ